MTSRKCRHYQVCGQLLEGEASDDLCLLHSTRIDKNADAFHQIVTARLAANNFSFDYFVFPSGTSNFSTRTFDSHVSFSHAVFRAETLFLETTFDQDVDFSSVTFESEANFSKARIKGPISFKGASFENVHFYDSSLEGEAHFTNCNFAGTANFTCCKFASDTYFDKSVFDKDTHFYEAAFHRYSSFDFTVLRDTVVFKGLESNRLFSGTKETSFVSVLFEQPHKVYFDTVTFARCSLLRTDLRGINLDNVKWANWRRRLCLYDEIKAIHQKRKDEYVFVEILYTQLKKHWEAEMQFEVAGFFHYGEKEMRRRSRSIMRDPLVWLYWILSGYSELPGRAFAWLVHCIISSALDFGNLSHTYT